MMLQVQAEIVDRKFSGAAQELRLAAPALAACGQNPQQNAAPPPPTVTVALEL